MLDTIAHLNEMARDAGIAEARTLSITITDALDFIALVDSQVY